MVSIIMVKRRWLVWLWLMFLAGASLAATSDNAVYFDDPIIGGQSWQAIEKGAYGSFDIVYNNTVDTRFNTAILNFAYNPSIINIISLENLNPAILNIPVKNINPDNVEIQLLPVGTEWLNISGQTKVRLVKVKFQVKKAAASSVLGLVWSRVELVTSAGLRTIGDSNFQALPLNSGKGPAFEAGAQISVANADNVGNRLDLSWPLASDNDGQSPPAATEPLRYRVYVDGVLKTNANGQSEQTFQASDLADNVSHQFQVVAIDDCRLDSNPNNLDSNASSPLEITGISHDYTAPVPTITVTDVGNTSLTLSLRATGDDVDQYILAKKVLGLNEPIPDINAIQGINSAEGINNGTLPGDVRTILGGAGWTVLPLPEPRPASYADDGLDNTKKHVYVLFVNDEVVENRSQGNNWGRAITSGVPGTAPADVVLFRALSSIQNGVKFVWQPPGGSYAGTKIVYTTNIDEWTSLNFASPEAVDRAAPDVDWLPANPASDSIYYFKAFSHNSSGLHQRGAYGAAVLGGSGGTLRPGAMNVEMELKRRDNGFGLNTILFPFDGPYFYAGNVPVNTVQELIDVINSLGGPGTVASFGYWDQASQQAVGYAFDQEAAKAKYRRGVETDPSGVALQKNLGYQISVRRSVPAFTLSQ